MQHREAIPFDREVVDDLGAEPILGIPRATLRTWRARRCGPPFLKIGRRALYRVADLRRWRDERLVTP